MSLSAVNFKQTVPLCLSANLIFPQLSLANLTILTHQIPFLALNKLTYIVCVTHLPL